MTDTSIGKITPVILSGGFGSRLWPLSRRERPKQFLPIFSGQSLFQKTCERVSSDRFQPPLVISNQDHRFLIGEQMAELGIEPQAIVLEPCGRNTAAPAALAALMALENDENAIVLLLPSDHLVADEHEFHSAVEAARSAVEGGQILTFGIEPSEPNTGYGYIKLCEGTAQVRKVDAFVEKPDLETAEEFLKAGNYLWNAGIFMYSAASMRAAFLKHAPDIWEQVGKALKNARKDLDFLRLEEETFAQVRNISFDYAIMENEENVACVPTDPGWSDLGSWPAIWESMPKNDEGNSALGEAIFEQSKNCLVYSDDALVSVVGLSDVMIVNTKDALLVTAKDKAQDVKKIVEQLDKANRPETIQHRRLYRPWGWSERISEGERYRVQSMQIEPGKGLTLQRHIHRAEHWVVVSGTLEVTIDGNDELISENQSVFVPLGARHKLQNPGKIPVRMIEVQSGAYIAEDDILRV
ncbi:Alginate biosynthesis protein AlgA [Pseudovibrio axinellae]|uniref:mannose-1-phosphate guanylyltransferase n=1 Tax=Pseudovibrio axinellae TaxID=989403 RepID=A0A166AGI3_9HYPH|nr:mannose-1-phosphate guanylyltransferase/mannose-6-phosphate isomerase [Pseudovibrio axinellae]KZL21040.1 Alginate biosynthesis protein AlgA [Pseudovibrio axinellae]SEP77887.1 mannose-1-phosphate guanylyltransferase/mannose-1-phosphate guanylyltransferase / mannose-6-phosphate isomerase [Pseudovibrio axinellae]